MRIKHVERTAQFANTMQEQNYIQHTKSSFYGDAFRNVICVHVSDLRNIMYGQTAQLMWVQTAQLELTCQLAITHDG